MAEEDEVEVAAAVEVEEDVSDLPGAVRGVLKRALVVDGVIRDLHEVAKYIDAGKAQVVFLAESLGPGPEGAPRRCRASLLRKMFH
mmetsp:Transcript_409/g.1699  ORF Transcript_409/g.1699 Transcript_409/m.1699 type:complete len:86 (-) Transcript_409:67-324(-)